MFHRAQHPSSRGLVALLASMGIIGDCYGNAMMGPIWGTVQRELLDTKAWQTRDELANAVFEWVEFWYNPKTHYSSVGMLAIAPSPSKPSAPGQTKIADSTPLIPHRRYPC